MYSSELGRFLQTDPIGYDDSMNLYHYVDNSPVNYVDPMGLKPGDPYPTADAAATDAINDINPTSIRESKEYAGWVYKQKGGTYTYTKPDRGGRDWSMPGGILGLFGIRPWNTAAYYHTHGSNDPGYMNENFSSSDINLANSRKIDAYLGTPGGSIKKYTHTGGAKTTIGVALVKKDANTGKSKCK